MQLHGHTLRTAVMKSEGAAEKRDETRRFATDEPMGPKHLRMRCFVPRSCSRTSIVPILAYPALTADGLTRNVLIL